jgi:hypothetical protein
MSNEVWKDVIGEEGRYQVSSLGQVRSVARYVRSSRWNAHDKRFNPARVLKQSVATTGYYVVGFPAEGNRTCKREVHTLVAAAFLGPRPAQHHTHHINENKLDNRPENLVYISHSNHSHFHGISERPKRNARFTREDVLKIRAMLAEGNYTQWEIAHMYGAHQAQISAIKRRIQWKHI